MTNHEPLLNKKEMAEKLGVSEEFIGNLPLPKYKVGRRYYYRISDYEPTLSKIKEESKAWVSTKIRNHRTGSTISRSKVLDFEAALRL